MMARRKSSLSPELQRLNAALKRTKKKSSSKKVSKKKTNTPAVRHLRYQITTALPGLPNSYFFDLFYHLSLVNRRMYRQGQLLFIKKITIVSRNTQNGFIQVSAAPTSWVTSNSWKTAFKLWMEMRKGHGGAPGSGLPTGVTPATWADFKVWLNENHRNATLHRPLPVDRSGNVVSIANSEWVHSKFVRPDTTGAGVPDEFECHLLGPNVGPPTAITSAGIIQGYENSRRTVQQDDTGTEIDPNSWMVNLFDDGQTLDEIAQDLADDGDLPPYNLEQYTGGGANMPEPIVQQEKSMVPYAYALPLDFTPSITLGSVVAPCGLIQIDVQSSNDDDTFDVLIEIQEGSAKGVKALPM